MGFDADKSAEGQSWKTVRSAAEHRNSDIRLRWRARAYWGALGSLR